MLIKNVVKSALITSIFLLTACIPYHPFYFDGYYRGDRGNYRGGHDNYHHSGHDYQHHHGYRWHK